MYYYVSINIMSNFMLTITDSVSKSAEGPIGLYWYNNCCTEGKVMRH
jgi:hypothetical protein